MNFSQLYWYTIRVYRNTYLSTQLKLLWQLLKPKQILLRLKQNILFIPISFILFIHNLSLIDSLGHFSGKHLKSSYLVLSPASIWGLFLFPVVSFFVLFDCHLLEVWYFLKRKWKVSGSGKKKREVVGVRWCEGNGNCGRLLYKRRINSLNYIQVGQHTMYFIVWFLLLTINILVLIQVMSYIENFSYYC